MFGIGGWEFVIIAVLALLLFGPDKLPQIARTVGRFMRDFKRYQDLMESTIRAEIYAGEPPANPFAKGKEFREKVQSGAVGGTKSDETSEEPAESAGDTDADAAAADKSAGPEAEPETDTTTVEEVKGEGS